MSDKELNRVNIIQAVCEKRLRRRDAASQLNLTERQVQRLVNRYRELGIAGFFAPLVLTSKKSPAPSESL